jgi:hypothetical protein
MRILSGKTSPLEIKYATLSKGAGLSKHNNPYNAGTPKNIVDLCLSPSKIARRSILGTRITVHPVSVLAHT